MLKLPALLLASNVSDAVCNSIRAFCPSVRPSVGLYGRNKPIVQWKSVLNHSHPVTSMNNSGSLLLIGIPHRPLDDIKWKPQRFSSIDFFQLKSLKRFLRLWVGLRLLLCPGSFCLCQFNILKFMELGISSPLYKALKYLNQLIFQSVFTLERMTDLS